MFDCMYECVCDCMFDFTDGNIPQEMCELECKDIVNREQCNSMTTQDDKKLNNKTEILKISKFKINYKELKGRPCVDFYVKDRKVHCILYTGARVNVIKDEIIKNMIDINIRETK